MTAEELEQLVLDGKDGWEIQRAAELLDEAERARLSTAAQKLQDQLHRCKANAQASPRLRKLMFPAASPAILMKASLTRALELMAGAFATTPAETDLLRRIREADRRLRS